MVVVKLGTRKVAKIPVASSKLGTVVSINKVHAACCRPRGTATDGGSLDPFIPRTYVSNPCHVGKYSGLKYPM